MCRNCDGRGCMSCVFREVHDRCEWSCPFCKDKPRVEKWCMWHGCPVQWERACPGTHWNAYVNGGSIGASRDWSDAIRIALEWRRAHDDSIVHHMEPA